MAKFTFTDRDEAKLLFRTAYNQIGSSDTQTQVDIEKREITGSVTSGNFCGYLGEFNRRSYYTLHFIVKLDAPILGSGVWQDASVVPNETHVTGGTGYGVDGVPTLGTGSGAWVELGLGATRTVNMRVGISYVSLENARANLEAEQGAGTSFTGLKQKADRAWNDALSKIRVVSDDTAKLNVFYTALYHSQFHPNVFSDSNGEYTGFDGKTHRLSHGQTHQYANFSGWDVYRSQLQLVALLDAQRGSDIAQSLFNQASQYNGVWDRWTHNSGPTGVMAGDPSTIAVANFVAFGASHFDVSGAYESLRKAATIPTQLDLSDEGCPVFCRGQRPSLNEWMRLNYLSDQSNSWEGASETLEQASADFALSQLASSLGHEDDAVLFLRRSSNWQNLYNANATEQFGYIQGRNQDGSWKDGFDPYNEGLFVEGSPAQYLWMIPFDGNGLRTIVGGDAAMKARLDGHFHKANGDWALYRDEAQYADVSNQPSIVTPWMYLFAGHAHSTQQAVRETMKQLWQDSPKGIPGQDDLGQMSSWYVFSALGIYPLYPGRADLVLSSPQFRHARIGNLTLNAAAASDDNIYISECSVNGKSHRKSWINDDYIQHPVTLEFQLTDVPNLEFGAAAQDRPPSYRSETPARNGH